MHRFHLLPRSPRYVRLGPWNAGSLGASTWSFQVELGGGRENEPQATVSLPALELFLSLLQPSSSSST